METRFDRHDEAKNTGSTIKEAFARSRYRITDFGCCSMLFLHGRRVFRNLLKTTRIKMSFQFQFLWLKSMFFK